MEITKMKTEELKPCPFCEVTDHLSVVKAAAQDLRGNAVRCGICGTQGPVGEDEILATMYWDISFRRADNWISVEDALPKEKEICLFVRKKRGELQQAKGWYELKPDYWYSTEDDDFFKNCVTHWKPLPELPKEK